MVVIKGGKSVNWNMDYGLDKSSVLMVDFLILIIVLFSFLGNVYRSIEG